MSVIRKVKGDIAQSCDERGELGLGGQDVESREALPVFFLQCPVLNEQPGCLVTYMKGSRAALCLVKGCSSSLAFISFILI